MSIAICLCLTDRIRYTTRHYIFYRNVVSFQEHVYLRRVQWTTTGRCFEVCSRYVCFLRQLSFLFPVEKLLSPILADCSAYRGQDSCLASRSGGKCYWVKGRCAAYAEAVSKIDDDKLDASKMEKSCQFTGIGGQFDCSRLRDCATCVTNGIRSCQWCNGQCRSDCGSSLAAPVGETVSYLLYMISSILA